MGAREDAQQALDSTDWTGASVEYSPQTPPAMIVHSVRLPASISEWVEREADRLGVKPSVVIRNLVERAAVPSYGDLVLVRRDELQQGIMRAVEQATQPAA